MKTTFNPNLPPMKAIIFEVIFSLRTRNNMRAILENMTSLCLRTPKKKEFKFDPFIGSKLGFKFYSQILTYIFFMSCFKGFYINATPSPSTTEFWSEQASCLQWYSPWKHTLEWTPPYAKWYTGAKLNACYNCLDRHMESTPHKTAILWENENGESLTITYQELFILVNKFSNVLKSMGIQKGDRVAIYLPNTPEAVIAMLSCARIGAIHTVVFGGFSANALKDRLLDVGAKLLITADGGFRNSKLVPLKASADQALAESPCVQNTIVVRHANCLIAMTETRDYWYDELMVNASEYCPCEEMDSEDTLFILYTSGTTGKPKGIIHTTGGYMVGVTMTTRRVFDISNDDKYFCTADVGWITGHSYMVYGPLSNNMTILMYEGAFEYPHPARLWQVIEKYKITILYTAPTAIRRFMKLGESWLKDWDLSSLRILGSVGEPINKEAWEWYHQYVGLEKCPIVDTWWQTETGAIMISPLPGITTLKSGSASFPLPGIEMAILDEQGNPATSGYLVVTSPWPSMLRGIYNNPIRYEESYWNRWKKGYYNTGDGASIDEEGYYWIKGRVDDVINVSGHRLSTAEIENALACHLDVAEAAAIAVAHPIKGQDVVAFIVLKESAQQHSEMENILKQQVVHMIGAIARPEKIVFVHDLVGPEKVSFFDEKIMR